MKVIKPHLQAEAEARQLVFLLLLFEQRVEDVPVGRGGVGGRRGGLRLLWRAQPGDERRHHQPMHVLRRDLRPEEMNAATK